ncbi:MAG TPA: hypothetical protein VEK79_24870 [Thermoanaerobaculia bacterium]|nr:hypothetical protein [Thermoanaerobaculia bacterium]
MKRLVLALVVAAPLFAQPVQIPTLQVCNIGKASTISDLRVPLIEQMTSVGKHTPTTYMNGRCTANGGTLPCHFRLMLADNHTTSIDSPADVLSGPIKSGAITVTTF